MTACRLRARAACLEYVRLRGQLGTLPFTHPTRLALVAAVAHADRRWRTLAAAQVVDPVDHNHTRESARPVPPSPQ